VGTAVLFAFGESTWEWFHHFRVWKWIRRMTVRSAHVEQDDLGPGGHLFEIAKRLSFSEF
jgi:hypothetical protein